MEAKDYFGADAAGLRNKRLFLFDMDGTIYEEDRLFDGTLKLLKHIKEGGGCYVFITNNSSRSVADYLKKVQKMGIEATEDNFFTSGQASALYLKKVKPHSIIYCQGTESLVKELRNAGIIVVTEFDERAEAVLVGFDTELTGGKIRNTCRMLQKDVLYIATNPDLRCPVGFGFIPDCGSICKMIEHATGKIPEYIGKPEAAMVDIVREKFGCRQEETVVIGDRLYTDIAVGINAGVTTVCVLSGEASVRDITEGNIKPDYTFLSVKEMADIYF